MFEEYNEKLIKSVLNEMKPENAIILLSAPEFKSTKTSKTSKSTKLINANTVLKSYKKIKKNYIKSQV